MTPAEQLALVDRLRRLPGPAREALYRRLAARGAGALATRRYDWPRFWSRPDQRAPAEDFALLVFTGPRGCGKTRAAVEYFNGEILAGRARRPRIFAATDTDVDEAVIHGESGIRTCLPSDLRPEWHKSDGVLVYPNGVRVVCFSARAPEGCVSHQGDLDLYDDVAKWGPHAETAWKHARASCRIGRMRAVAATTRRGTILLKRLLGGNLAGVVVRRPPDVRANRGNLAAKYFDQMAAELGGDRFFDEEINDEEISETSPFAGLEFEQGPIRIPMPPRADLEEVVVIVDPAEGKGGDHDEWGIGAAGRLRNRHGVALEDASGSYDDAEAAAKILELCERWGATKIIVENNRGPRVANAIRAAHLKRELDAVLLDPGARLRPMPEIIGVNAKDGKTLRAGPVRLLYLGGLLHHVPGLAALERQQRAWDPAAPKRPRTDDRIDWLVHAAHYLADLGKAPVHLPDGGYARANASFREERGIHEPL